MMFVQCGEEVFFSSSPNNMTKDFWCTMCSKRQMVKQFRLVRLLSWTKKLLKWIHFGTWKMLKKSAVHTCVYVCKAAAVLKFESEVWLFLHCCVDSLSHFMNERCDMLDMIAPSFLFYFIYFSSTTATESLATDSTQAATANHCLQFCSSICLENQTKFGQVTHKKSNLCVIHCSYWSEK